MKKYQEGKVAVSIVSAMMVLSFFGAGIASTGCLMPWQTMDNMVVGASVAVDEQGNFVVDGAVTSATVKALGYVASAESLSAAYDESANMNDKAGVKPSWYDSIRYNSTNRRTVDYERAAGIYSSYYGKDNWYDFYGAGSDNQIRDIPTTEYISSVASVSGLSVQSVWDDIGLTPNPTGQYIPSLELKSDLMRTFDMSGASTTNFGDISQFSANFGVQQFVFEMTDIVGSKWGKNDAYVFVQPDMMPEGTSVADLTGYDATKPSGKSIDVGIFINDGVKKVEVPDTTFVYANTYFVPNPTSGEVKYYAYVLTDALREMKHVGDEMTIEVNLMMVGIKVPVWADVQTDVNSYMSLDSSKLSTGVKDMLSGITSTSTLAIYDLTSNFNDFSSKLTTSISESLGAAKQPFGMSLLNGGIVNSILSSMKEVVDNIEAAETGQLYANGVAWLASVKSKYPSAKVIYDKLNSGDVNFNWQYHYLLDSRQKKVFTLTTITTPADINTAQADMTTRVNRLSTFTWFPNAEECQRWSADWEGGKYLNRQYVGEDGSTHVLLYWINWINGQIKACRDAYQTTFDSLSLGDVKGNVVLDGGCVRYFSGTITHVKTESVTDKTSRLITTAIDDVTAKITGQYKEMLSTMNATIIGIRTQYDAQIANLTSTFATSYAYMYDNLNLSFGVIKGLNDTIWNLSMDIDLLNLDIFNMQSVIQNLTLDLTNQTELTNFYYAQYNNTSNKLSSMIMDLDKYGFATGWSAENNVWLFDVDFEKFNSNFNIFRSVNIAPASYIFSDNMIDGMFNVPVKLDVTNPDMLNDTKIDFYAKSVTIGTGWEYIKSLNCSYEDGNVYTVPIASLGMGTYDIKATATFDNGTIDPFDDVVFETTPDYGFGGNVQILEKSLEDLLLIADGYNPMFLDVDAVNVVFKLDLYDTNDKMYLPPVSFIGGNMRTATVTISSSTSIKWSVNYIRQHTYTGVISIFDLTGELIQEVEIPSFTLKNAAFAESSRSSDTLSISDFNAGTEFVAIGTWNDD